jgi:hypothetical protein
MKTTDLRHLIFVLSLFIILVSGCNPFSTMIKDDNNKMNGSFETVKENLPVNWYYYSPDKVPNSDFDIISDNNEFKEGNKSLKFIVRKCEPIGGWHSTGFFQDFNALHNETYKVSFWVINKGCEFKIALQSSEEGKGGPYETVLQTKDTILEWKYFEFQFKTAPAIDMIRFEANILSPGTIWFDDIKIEGETDKDERTLMNFN